MGPGKASSVEAFARSAGSIITQTRSRRRLGGVPVLYVDRGVIVLNKPPGLVSQGTSESRAAQYAKNDFPPAASAFNDVLEDLRRRFDLNKIPYPVHRLDKGTTGALILARTKALARELSQQFRTHAIEKSYLALVRGAAKSFPVKEGLITASLRSDDGRVRVHAADTQAQAEPAGGKPARTAWEVLASSDIAPLSLVRLYPHTGLKHQLRVHMAQVLKGTSMPVLGDALYGSAATRPPMSTTRTAIPEGRLFLHSSSISFWRYRREGLRKRFRLTITAPLPEDFVKMCRDTNLGLPEGVIEGGVLVDGERLKGEEIAGVDGRWLREPFSF
ncbi:pseudouridine synthase [Russula brevipes]|nr:pseudouridine synthase [Russula brevipes]